MEPTKLKLRDPNGRHLRIYASVVNSLAWRALSYSAKALYVDLRDKMTSTNNGNIEAAISTLRHKGWKSPATLAKALYELRALGFIVQTRGGGVELGSRVCSLFRFTDVDTYDFPHLGVQACKATHDYAKYKTLAEAEAALRVGVQNLRAKAVERKAKASDRKKTTLQILNRTDTETVAMPPVDRYRNCSSGVSTDTKTVAMKSEAKRRKAARIKASSPIAGEA